MHIYVRCVPFQDRRSARDHYVYFQQQFGAGDNWSYWSGRGHVHVHSHLLEFWISGPQRDHRQFL